MEFVKGEQKSCETTNQRRVERLKWHMSNNRKLNRDHAKKTQRPMVEDEVIANQLEALLTPAITAQENYYRQLGLRDRILNLPLMVAAVLTLLWRDVAGVTELTRILAREGFLWCNPTQVSQQAVSTRFLTFPSELFEKIFKDLFLFDLS